MGNYSVTAAFLSGLLGAAHCVGMCGGLNGGFFAGRGVKPSWSPVLYYHITRILAYTALGVGGAFAGRLLMQSGIVGKVQGVVMMLAGIWIVLIGITQLQRERNSVSRSPAVLRYIPDPANTKAPMFAGLVNGLVPCGLASTVAIQAAASADPAKASVLMLAFGLGTVPAMGLLSFAATFAADLRGKLKQALAITLIALGAWTFQQAAVFFNVIRGLGNW